MRRFIRDFLNDLWETIIGQTIDISESTTFKQARQWFSRQGIPEAKAAKTLPQLREILLDDLASRPFDTNDTLSYAIRRYLNGLDEDSDTNRPEELIIWRMLHAETLYDLETAQNEYRAFKQRRSNP